MVSLTASTPVAFRGNMPQKSAQQAQLGSVQDIVDAANKKGKEIQNGAAKVDEAAQNVAKTVQSVEKASTSILASATTAAGSITAIFGLFKPMADKVKNFVTNPEIKANLKKAAEKSQSIASKIMEKAKNNPKMALAAFGIAAAAVTAMVIGKAIVKAKSQKAETTAEAKPEPAAAEPEKKLDVVSEA